MQLGGVFRRSRIIVAVLLASTGAALLAVRFASPSRELQAERCLLSEAAGRGRLWAPTCKGCHDIDAHHPSNPTGGPNLHDVYLSVAGTQSLRYGYQYRQPLVAARNAGLIWTDTNLDRYLESPESFLARVTGKHFDQTSYMNFFIGGQEPSQMQARRDVVAYLKAIKGRPCS